MVAASRCTRRTNLTSLPPGTYCYCNAALYLLLYKAHLAATRYLLLLQCFSLFIIVQDSPCCHQVLIAIAMLLFIYYCTRLTLLPPGTYCYCNASLYLLLYKTHLAATRYLLLLQCCSLFIIVQGSPCCHQVLIAIAMLLFIYYCTRLTLLPPGTYCYCNAALYLLLYKAHLAATRYLLLLQCCSLFIIV